MMEEDHCVYIKRSNIGFIILSLYLDDIFIVGSDKKLIDVTKKWLSSNFEMKDMVRLAMCLVLRSLGIAQNDSWVYLRRLTFRKC